MSQHDYNIANATFPNVRTDLNNALGAIATNNSGDSAPSTTYANQFWYETDTNKLYIRNEDNDAWIHILTLNQTNDTVASVEGASTFAGIDDQSSSNDDQITITDSAVIINEDSDDLDTRIESNGNANMLFVDGGNDHINIGTATDLGGVLNVAGTAVIQTADNSDTLSLISTDADATSGPNLRLFRNSSSPADGDDIGKIIFSAENDASEEIDYITIRGDLTDVTDGTEDGVLKIAGLIGGAVKEFARFGDGVGVVFNEESNAANDFRIESDALSHAFFLDGGTDHISIGNSSTSLYTLDIKQNSDFTGSSSDTANEAPLRVWSTHSNGRGAIAIGGNNNNGIFNKGTSDLVIQGYNAITFDCSQTNDDKFGTKTERFAISNVGKLSTGAETDPDIDPGGITLDQNAGDGYIKTFKSSDIAHGFTGLAETDSFATFGKASGTDGGLTIQGFHEGQGFGLQLIAHCKTAGFTNSNSTGYGHLDFIARGSNGSTGDAALEDNENCMSVRNGGNVKFIVKGDGDLFADGTLSAYDTYEDAQLVRAFDLSHGKGVIDSTFDKYVKYNHETLANANLVGREEDGTPNHFINVTGMQRLHNGAIWQQYEKTERLTQAMYELAKVAVGEEKANEILKQNEIKLLN